jgi:peptidylprolyl isomerase
MTRTLVIALTLGLCVTAAACGSETPAAPADGVTPTAAEAKPEPGTAPGIPPLTGNPTDVTKPSQAKAGAPPAPTTLQTKDIVVGKGKAATLDDTVNVRYAGTLYSDGTLFDSSWENGTAPISFPLDGVVKGFAQGIAGMQPGGRRVMVIPPDLGYGNRANGPIPAGSTLVFVVDLVSVG